MYLLSILSMLLFNKICSIAHVLRLLYVLPETGRKFNIYMNVHFKFYTQGITVWKYKTTFLGKVRIIIKQCHAKKNISKLKFSLRKPLTKKSSLLQLPTPHQSTVSAGSIKNYHRLFLYSSCLKRLRSTNLSSYPHVYWLLLFIIVFAHGSNIL